MINTLWNNIQRSDQMLITGNGAETGILMKQINLVDVQNLGDVAAIELDIFTKPGTAPGVGKTVTIWYAFCSDAYINNVAALVTAAASQDLALNNTAGTHAIYSVPLLYQTGKYLNIWFDHTANNAGTVLELNLSVNCKKS